MIKLLKLTDFYQGFYRACLFADERVFLGIALAIWVLFRCLKSKSGNFLGFSKKNSDEHTYHFNNSNESPPEQGKRTPTSAKSLSGLVRSKGPKAKPKTAELLRNVRRKSCSKNHSVGAQNTVTPATLPCGG